MKWTILCLLTISAPSAWGDAPFFVRGTGDNQSIGALNQNYLDQTNSHRDRLTTTMTPNNCPSAEALTGAYYHNGSVFGGTCTPIAALSGSTVTTAAPISGNGSSESPVSLTGAIPPGLVSLSTVAATGSCTLPNVVTAVNWNATPTCSQPSNVTGSAASITGTLNAGQLTNGPVASSILPSTAAYTSVANSFGPAQSIPTISSTVTIQGDAFSVGGSSFTVVGGSATVAYQTQTGSLNLQNVKSGTQCLHADGSGNVTGSGADCGSGGGGGASTMTVTWVVDNFLPNVTGSQKTFTLSQTPSSSQALMVYLDGLLQSGASDYSYTPPTTVTFTTAPAANTSQFQAVYTINTSTLPAAMLTTSTDTVSGAKTFTSSVRIYLATASLTGLSATVTNIGWASCNVSGSTITITVSTTTRGFVTFNGIIGETTINTGSARLWLLIDGQFPPGYTAARPNCLAFNANSDTYDCNIALFTNQLSTGSHSFCLGMSTGGASQSASLFNSDCTGNNSCGGNSFQVIQIPVLN